MEAVMRARRPSKSPTSSLLLDVPMVAQSAYRLPGRGVYDEDLSVRGMLEGIPARRPSQR
jgi:hypothetical protein